MRVIGLAVVLGISLVLAPLLGEAQPTPVKLAMLLTSSPEGAGASEYAAFAKQLSALGWIEGQNLEVDRRWANAPENFFGLAADAVRAKPAVILAAGPDATRAAQQATSAIPIVMIAATDPRVVGVVSFAHPGSNVTGLTIGQPEVSEKRLQLVKEALPALARVAVLWDVDRTAYSGPTAAMMTSAARVLGLHLLHFDVKGGNFAAAFSAAKKDLAEAVLLVEGRGRSRIASSSPNSGSSIGCRS